MNNKLLLQTSDLLICTVLLYFDHTLEKIDHSNGHRCLFFIEKNTNTSRLIEKFYKGQLKVEPKKFQSISREIKSRIYN